MRTINRRDPLRGGRSDQYRRDDWQSRDNTEPENVYGNEYYDFRDEHSAAFANRDYDGRNFWIRSQNRNGPPGMNEREYLPGVEDDFRWRRHHRPSGYGNENSEYMSDFRRWRRNNINDNLTARRHDNDAGYRGRDAGNYNSSEYGDNYDYRTADFEGGDFSRDDVADNYNEFSEDRREYRHGRTGSRQGRNDPDYNYYESYPSYGQGAPYNDHEYGYIEKQESRRNRGIDNEDNYSTRVRNEGRRRGFEEPGQERYRSSIRNKTY